MGMLRFVQAGGPNRGAFPATGTMIDPTGSTIPRLSSALSGTRPGFSSIGGEISTPVTAPSVIAIRTVRVIFELAAVVAKVAGRMWPGAIAPAPVAAPLALERIAARPLILALASM